MANTLQNALQMAKQYEKLARERREKQKKATDLVNAAQEQINTAKKVGIDCTKAEELISQAKNTLKGGDNEKAYNLANDCSNEVKKAYERHAQSLYKDVQGLLPRAESVGADGARFIDPLSQVKGAIDAKEYNKAIDLSGKIKKDIEESITRIVVDAIEGYAQPALNGARGLGIDLSKADELMTQARAALASKDYEKAHDFALRCGAEVEISKEKGVPAAPSAEQLKGTSEAEYERAKGFIAQATAVGIADVSKWTSQADSIKASIEGKNYGPAVEATRKLIGELEDAIKKVVDAEVAEADGKIAELEKDGTKADNASKLIGEAKGECVKKCYDKAHALAKASIEELEKIKASRAKSGEKIASAFAKLKLAQSLGIQLGELGNELDAAKQKQETDFASSVESVAKVNEELEKRLSAKMVEVLKGAQSSIEAAKRIGVEVTAQANALANAKSALDAKDFEKANDIISKSISEAGKIQKEFLDGLVKFTESTIENAVKLGADTGRATELIAQAKTALDSGEYERSFSMAKLCSDELGKVQYGMVSELLRQAQVAVDIAKKIGIDINEYQNLIAQSKTALDGRDYVKALQAVTRAKDEPAKAMGEHLAKGVQNLETSINAALSLGCETSKASEVLEQAKKALEVKEYEKCNAAAKQAAEELVKAQLSLVSETIMSTQTTIANAQKIGADVTHANELLNKAEAAQEGKDFTKALEFATQAGEEADRSQNEMLTNALSQAKMLIGVGEKAGLKFAGQLDALNDAANLIKSREFEMAHAVIKQTSTEIEKSVFTVVTETMQNANASVANAKKLGLDVSIFSDMLTQAKAAHDAKDYVKAFDISSKVIEAGSKNQKEVVQAAIDTNAAKIAEIEGQGVNLDKIKGLLTEAKEQVEKGEFRKALEQSKHALEQAEKRKAALDDCISELKKAEDEVAKVGALGFSVDEVKELFNLANGAVKDGKYEEAKDYAMQTLAEIENLVKGKVNEIIAASLAAIQATEKIGADVSKASELLNKAKVALESKSYGDAVAHAKEASDIAQALKKDYLAASENLAIAQKELASADALGADTKVAKETWYSAKALLGNNEYAKCMEASKKALVEVEAAKEKFVSESITSSRAILAEAQKMGADIRKSEEALEKAEAAFTNKEYEKALEFAKTSREEARSLHEGAQHVLDTVLLAQSKITEAVNVGVNVAEIQKLLEGAKLSLKNNDFDVALEYAKQAGEEAEKLKGDFLKATDAIQFAKSKILEAEKLGADLKRATELQANATEAMGRGEYDKAVSIANESVKESEACQLALITKVIAATEKVLSDAQALGADVATPQASFKKAKDAVEKKAYDSALMHSKECMEQAKGIIENFKAASEAIKAAEVALAEADELKAENSVGLEQLEHARAAMTVFEYAEVISFANKSAKESKQAQENKVKASIKSAEDTLDAAVKIGANVDKPKETLKDAVAMLASGDYKGGLNKAEETLELAETIMLQYQDAIDSIKAAEEKLAGAKKLGVEVLSSEEMLKDAKVSLENFEYANAKENAVACANEIEALENKFVLSAISSAQTKLQQAQKIEVDTKKAEELINEAKGALNRKDYEQAFQLANKCSEDITGLQYKKVSDALVAAQNIIADGQKIGADLNKARGLLKNARAALEGNDFANALNLAQESAKESEGAQNTIAKDTIESAEGLIADAESIGVDLAQIKGKLGAAKEALMWKNYSKAVELANGCIEGTEGMQETLVEAKINEAQISISDAEKIRAQVKAAQEQVDNAKKLLEARDFAGALAAAGKSLEESHNAQDALVKAAQQAAKNEIEKAIRLGANVAKAEELLKGSATTLSNKDFEVALECANQSKIEAETTQSILVTEAISNARAAIVTAQGLGAEVNQFDEEIKKAAAFQEAHDYEQAFSAAKKIVSSIDSTQKDHVVKVINEATAAYESAKSLGSDIAMCADLLEQAKVSLDGKDYSIALEFAKQCIQESASSQSKLLSAQLAEVQGIIVNAHAMSADVSKAEFEFNQAKTFLESKDYTKAIDRTKAARQEAERAQFTLVEKAINDARNSIASAKGLGADVSACSESLADAERKFEGKQFKSALEQAQKAIADAERTQSDLAARAVADASTTVENAKRLGAEPIKAAELLDEATLGLDNKEFSMALKSAGESKHEAERAMHEHVSHIIINAQNALTSAMRTESDVTRAKELLDEAKVSLNSKEFEKALFHAKRCKEEAENAQLTLVSSVLSAAEATISDSEKLGVDVTSALEMLDNAKKSMDAKEFEKALDAGKKAKKSAEDGAHQLVLEAITSSTTILEEAKKLDANVDQAKELLDQARIAMESSNFEEALDFAIHAGKEAESTQASVVEEVIKMAQAAVVSAKELGINLPKADKWIEESTIALANKDYAKALESAKSAENESNKRKAQFQQATDAISLSKMRLTEAHALGTEAKAGEELLERAQGELENANYESAFASAVQAGEQAEKCMNEFVSEAIKAAKEQIKAAKEAGANVAPSEEGVRSAEASLKEGAFQKAMGLATDAGKAADKAKGDNAACKEAIASAERDIERAKALGAMIAKPQATLVESKTKFGMHDYKFTLDAAKRCSEESHQVMAMFVDAALMSAMATIVESEQAGTHVGEARNILEDAKRALAGKDYEGASGASSKAKELATKRRAQYLKAQELIQKAKEEIKQSDALGADGALAVENLALSETALSNHDYDASISSAEKAIEESHTARETIVTESILAAEGIITECKLNNIEIGAAEKMLGEARKKLEARSYQEAMNVAMRAGDEAEARRKLFTDANSEIDKAKVAIDEANEMGADVKECSSWLERARGLLKSHSYDNAMKQASECLARVEKIKGEFSSATDSINSAKALIETAEKIGGEVSSARSLLDNAKRHLKLNDYAQAKAAADKAFEQAKSTQKELSTKAMKQALDKLIAVESLGGKVRDADAIFDAAETLFDEGKYDESIATISNLIKQCDEARDGYYNAMAAIREAHAAMVNAEYLDVFATKSKELLAHASAMLETHDYLKAKEFANNSRASSLEAINDLIVKQSDNLKKLIEEIEGQGAVLNEPKTNLKKALEILECNDYKRAMDYIELGKGYAEKVRDQFQQATDAITMCEARLKDAMGLGIETGALFKMIDESNALLSEREYTKAFDKAISTTKEVDNAIYNYITSRMAAVQSQIGLAIKLGAVTTVAEGELSQAKAAFEAKDYQKAIETTKRAQSEVETAQSEVVESGLATSSAAIEVIKRIGGDASKPMELLSRSRDLLEARSFEQAFATAKSALEESEKVSTRVVLDAQSQARSSLMKAEKTGADLSSAKSFLDQSSQALRKKEFEVALDFCKQSQTLLDNAQHAYLLDLIGRAKIAYQEAMQVGASVAAEESMIMQAQSLLVEKNFDKGTEVAKGVIDKVSAAALEIVSDVLELSGSLVQSCDKLGADSTVAKEMLKQAYDAMEGSKYQTALELAKQCEDACELAHINKLDEISSNVRALLQEVENMGADATEMKSHILNAESAKGQKEFQQAAEHLGSAKKAGEHALLVKMDSTLQAARNMLTDAVRAGANISKSESLIKDAETAKSQKNTKRAIELATEALDELDKGQKAKADDALSVARQAMKDAERIGAEITKVDGILRNAEAAISDRKYIRALEQSEEAKKAAREAQVALVKEALASATSIVNSAGELGADISKAKDMLLQSKKALDNSSFEEAIDFSLQGEKEAERAQQALLSSMIQSAKDIIENADKIGGATAKAKELVQEAEMMLSESEFSQSMSLVKEAIEEAGASQKSLIEGMISEGLKISQEARSLGADVSKGETLLAEGRRALQVKDYLAAYQQAKQGASMVRDAKTYYQGANEAISSAKVKLANAKKINANITKARDLLNQAMNAMKTAEYARATDLAQEAGRESDRACEQTTAEAVLDAKGLIDDSLALGMVVGNAQDILGNAEAAVKSKDFEKAIEQARQAKGIVEGIKKLFTQASDALRVAESEVAGAKKSGVPSTEAEELLNIAKTEMNGGDYLKVIDFAKQCGEELKKGYSDLAAEVLNSAQFKMTYIKNIGAGAGNAETMLQQATQALNAKDFVKAYDFAKQAGEEADRIKIKYKEIIDITFKADSLIMDGKGQGIDMSNAEKLLQQALLLKSKNIEEAVDYANQAIEEARRSVESFNAELAIELTFSGTLFKDEWIDAELVVKNTGRAHAKEVDVKLSGNVEVEGLTPLGRVRGTEVRKVPIRIKPNRTGDLPLKVSATYKREFDNKDASNQEVKWLKVDEKPAPKPLTSAPTTGSTEVGKRPPGTSVRCHICLGTIKSGLPIVKCECGKTYHETCAIRVGECPNCGRVVSDKEKWK